MRRLPIVVLVCGLVGVAASEDDGRFGPARALETPERGAPAPGDQIAVAVTGDLAIWIDGRVAPILRATIVDTGRTFPLPAAPPLVGADAATAQHVVAAATGGGVDLVVWQDTHEPAGLRATRITPEGAILDPGGLRIATGGQHPALAWDGTQFLIAWSDAGNVLRVARVSLDGKVLDPGGRLVGGWEASTPAIASDGDAALVVWTQPSGDLVDGPFAVRAARVQLGDAGAQVDQVALAGTGDDENWEPDVVWDGTAYDVVWHDGDLLRLARVSAAGDAGAPITVAELGPRLRPAVPTVSWNGGRLLVTWLDVKRTLQAAAIATDGSVGEPLALATDVLAVAATADAPRTQVVWTVWQDVTELDVIGAMVADRRPVARTLATALAWQIEPVLVSSRELALAAWSTWTEDGGADVHGAILDEEGEIRVPAFEIAASADDDRGPAIAPTPDGFAVAWRRGGEVAVTHVDAHGRVRDGGIGLGAASEDAEVALARGDHDLLAAWIAGDRVVGRRLDALARPLGDVFEIGECGGPCRAPRIAWAHTSYLVAWWVEPDVDGVTRIRGARVSQGVVIAPALDLEGAAVDLVRRGDGFLLAYAAADGVRTRPLDRLGRLDGDESLIPTAARPQSVALSPAADHALAVWSVAGATSIADLDADGALLDGPDTLTGVAHPALAGALLLTSDFARRVSVRSLRVLPPADGDDALPVGGCGCRGADDELTTSALVAFVLLLVTLRYSRRRWISRS